MIESNSIPHDLQPILPLFDVTAQSRPYLVVSATSFPLIGKRNFLYEQLFL